MLALVADGWPEFWDARETARQILGAATAILEAGHDIAGSLPPALGTFAGALSARDAQAVAQLLSDIRDPGPQEALIAEAFR